MSLFIITIFAHMVKMYKNMLLIVLLIFTTVLSLELCAFVFFDHHQVRIENVSKESASDVSCASEMDTDHDDFGGCHSIRAYSFNELKMAKNILPGIGFSDNTLPSVWLPPKLF